MREFHSKKPQKQLLGEMRSRRLNLGSMDVSCGAKDWSKRISKTKQDPNFDLPSLRNRTAILFSTTSPSSISTVDFSSPFHFLLLGVNQKGQKSCGERVENWKTRKFDLFKLNYNHKGTRRSYIIFKMLSNITSLLANITSSTQLLFMNPSP